MNTSRRCLLHCCVYRRLHCFATRRFGTKQRNFTRINKENYRHTTRHHPSRPTSECSWLAWLLWRQKGCACWTHVVQLSLTWPRYIFFSLPSPLKSRIVCGAFPINISFSGVRVCIHTFEYQLLHHHARPREFLRLVALLFFPVFSLVLWRMKQIAFGVKRPAQRESP